MNDEMCKSATTRPKLVELSDLFDRKLEEYEALSGEIYNRLSNIISFGKPSATAKEDSPKIISEVFVSKMNIKLNKFDSLNIRLAEVSEGLKQLVGE
jgi:hypothetical protein